MIYDLRVVSDFCLAEVGTATTPTTLLGLDRDLWTLETTALDRNKYKTTLEQVLIQLEPVLMQEQQFCVSFFQVIM